jgi:hypothetical protein
MANQMISELTELTTAAADDDLLVIVDVSDTTDSPTGTTKKITFANLVNAVLAAAYDSEVRVTEG